MADKNEAQNAKPEPTSWEDEMDALEAVTRWFAGVDAGARQRMFQYLASRFTLSLRSSDY